MESKRGEEELLWWQIEERTLQNRGDKKGDI
jgi:hypothetical protein